MIIIDTPHEYYAPTQEWQQFLVEMYELFDDVDNIDDAHDVDVQIKKAIKVLDSRNAEIPKRDE